MSDKLKRVKACKDSIQHWREMIRWAEQQYPHSEPDKYEIIQGIDQCWGASDCALCRYGYSLAGEYEPCYFCPLAKCYLDCAHIDSAWKKLDGARKWSTWVFYARMLLEELEKTLKEVEGEPG